MSGEVSRHNRDAMRGEHGIWNEDSLPVTEWEIPEQRVVVPAQLTEYLPANMSPVLRWDREKYDTVVQEHSRDLPVIRDLSRHLGHCSLWAKSEIIPVIIASCSRTTSVDGMPSASATCREVIT